MRLIKAIAVLLAAIIISLNLGACSDSYKDAFIYIDFDSTPTSLDPQLADSDEELTVVRSLFDTLLRYDGDGKLVPSGAESYSKDGLTYTFKLRTDAEWVGGEKVTAADYAFAIKRALLPETKAPFANSLFSIVGAEELNKGKGSADSLGVTVIDEYTLKIELKKDDPEFDKVLTTAVTMPCNEEFFNSCKGKYGLTIDTTASNGSYYIRQWLRESKFLIRLAKNLDYTGPFEANSMRIYFTCGEEAAASMLENDNTDLVYISTAEYEEINNAGFQVCSVEDTCFALFLSSRMDENLRRAFLSSVSSDTFSGSLSKTQRTADTLFPAILGIDEAKTVSQCIKYDLSAAAEIFTDEALHGTQVDKITIKYPAVEACNAVAKAVAAHWQQNLSCFINIEETPLHTINDYFNSGYYDILIIPFSAPTGTVSAYNQKLGFQNKLPDGISQELYENYRCFPLFYSSLNIASGTKIQNLETSLQGGIIDVSMLIKEQ